ncbi:protein BIG GRAIN 1-like [Triticum dicoccoides]|uniref:protein BIG GRAIN 1-like n=1 Tax=Triticum dicoccoides TaxID=85692 RepID=UPI001233D36F|nr:protein BIG GRAIN 1-like [Triticum dicoccoides]
MERGRGHGKSTHPPPLAPPRRARAERGRASGSGASFSASLLDTIYRSLDDGGGADVDAARRSEEQALAPAPPQFWWAGKPKQAAGAGADRRRRETGPAVRPRHSGYASSATSSSDSTSSYSFSCSSASTTDTESTCRRRSPPPPRRQLEEFVAPDSADVAAPVTTPGEKAKKKGRPCFPVARHRPRDVAPSSPGPPPPSPGTFACVLKALFTSGRLPRKPRTPTRATPPRTLPELPQPSCVSAATDASMAERRCVRFCSDAEASAVRRRVEELVRSLGELEEDDEGSDSSSDLFELESLGGANGDELPVYGTTSLVANRAIAHATVF